MDADRPILILEKSRTDKSIDILILITIVLTWILTIVNYNSLPEIIPIHQDLKGNIDNYGGKASIWFLPVISTLIIAGMRFINKFPHHFNYLVKITAGNARSQYTGATRMIRYFQWMVALVFLFIVYDVVHSAHSGSSFIGVWFVPVLFLTFLGPLLISLLKRRD